MKVTTQELVNELHDTGYFIEVTLPFFNGSSTTHIMKIVNNKILEYGLYNEPTEWEKDDFLQHYEGKHWTIKKVMKSIKIKLIRRKLHDWYILMHNKSLNFSFANIMLNIYKYTLLIFMNFIFILMFILLLKFVFGIYFSA